MNKSILIVEDQEEISKYLKEILIDHDYIVRIANNGASGLKIINTILPDLVLLDLGLPDIDGETVCREIKKYWPDLKVIVLTARSETSDIVKGLNFGADDYVAKPFKSEELLARIRTQLKDKSFHNSKKSLGDLELDTKTHEVKRNSKVINLTATEYKLLDYLLSNQGKVISRDIILGKIWLMSPDIETRTVDVYMGYLRKKIDNGFDQKLIHSVRGFGYMLKMDGQ